MAIKQCCNGTFACDGQEDEHFCEQVLPRSIPNAEGQASNALLELIRILASLSPADQARVIEAARVFLRAKITR